MRGVSGQSQFPFYEDANETMGAALPVPTHFSILHVCALIFLKVTICPLDEKADPYLEFQGRTIKYQSGQVHSIT